MVTSQPYDLFVWSSRGFVHDKIAHVPLPGSHIVRREGDAIHVELLGYMTEDVALVAIDEFSRAVPIDAREKFSMHVHLTKLDRYDSAAREAWARSLMGCRKQIQEIVVHDGKPLQRMAAAAVALALLVPIRFETTPDDGTSD